MAQKCNAKKIVFITGQLYFRLFLMLLVVGSGFFAMARAQLAEIVVEDQYTGASSDVTSVSTDASVLAVSDHFYLAVISSKSNANVLSVSGLGLTWQLIESQCSGRSHTGVHIWRGIGSASTSEVVTAILDDDPRNALINVVRFSGVDPDDPIGATLSANENGFDGNCSGGSDERNYSFNFSSSSDGSLIFGTIGSRNRSHTPGAGYTEISETSQGSGSTTATLALQTQLVNTAGTVSFDGTFSGRVDWAAAAIELQAGNAGPIFRTLTVNVSPGGTGAVVVNPDKALYDNGESVNLIATPAAGYEFANWSGDVSGVNTNSSTIDLVMNQDRTVTANFIPIQRTLTTSVDPSNGGSINASPDQATYDDGSDVTLTAVPAIGFNFVNWSGDIGAANSNNTEITLTMDQDRSVQANFTPIQQTLNVNVTPGGSGNVTVTPDQVSYDYGTSVNLNATAETGFEFVNWSGDIGGASASNPSIDLTMDQDRTVTANFAAIPEVVKVSATNSNDAPFTGETITVSVAVDMTGSFSLLGTIGGDLSWDETVLSYQSHSGLSAGFSGTVDITNVASGSIGFNGTHPTGADNTFELLSVSFQVIGSAGTTSTSDVSVNQLLSSTSADLLADLEENDDDLTVAGRILTTVASPTAGGSVSRSPDKNAYDNNEVVTLTATPASGFEFANWSGDIGGATSTDISIEVTMDQGRTVTANFTPIQRSLTLNVSPTATGSIAANPDKPTYDNGETVQLTAAAASGFKFSFWSGDIGAANPTDQTIDILMDQDRSITANFEAGPTEIVFEGATTGSSSGAFSVQTSSSVPAVGDQYYLAVISSKPFKNVTSVNGLGLNWIRHKQQCSGRSHNMVDIWIGVGTAVTSETVQATFDDDPNHAVIAVTRYSGVDTVVPIGETVSENDNGVDGNCSGGSDGRDYSLDLTTGADGAVVFSVASLRNKNHTPGAGYTERLEFSRGSGSDQVNIAIQDQTFDTAGPVVANGAFSGRVDWSAAALVLMPNGSSGPIVRTLNTTASPAIGGTVTVDPDKATYDDNESVDLTATPASGYEFVNWSGDIGGATATDLQINVMMNQNRTIVANFAPIQRTLTVTIDPIAGGNVAKDPDKATYDHGETVQLTATAAVGFEFVNWSGDIGGATATDLQINLTMDQDRNVQANFAPIQRTLTLTESPAIGGSAVAYPDKITYNHGETVTLTATPADGYEFINWTGDIGAATATDLSIDVVMDQDRNVQANFAEIPEVVAAAVLPDKELPIKGETVTVAIRMDMSNSDDMLGSFTGSLSWDTAVLSYNSNSGLLGGFTGTVDVANAATGNVGFNGTHASGASAAFDVLTLDFTVIGNVGNSTLLDLAFSALASTLPEDLLSILHVTDSTITVGGYALNVNASPANGGNIQLSPDQMLFDPGSSVTLTAVPNLGFGFANWSGDIADENPSGLSITVTMDQDRNITAIFSQIQQVLDYSASPAEAGAVTADPDKALYDFGESVTLTATPVNGFIFAGWGGEIGAANASDNPLTLTMDTNRDVIANFIPGSPEVTFEDLKTGTSGGANQVSTSEDVIAVEDHLYLAAISTKANKTTIGVTGLGLTWQLAKAQCSGRNNQTGSEIWWALGSPTGDGIVTAVFNGTPENAVIIVARYSGADTDNPIGTIISGNTNGLDGDCSGGSNTNNYSFDLTTSVENATVFGAIARRLNPHSPGFGFAERAEVQGGSGGSAAGLAIVDMQVETAGLVNFNGTFSSNSEWAFVGLELLPGGSTGPAKYILTTDAEPVIGGSVSRDPNLVIFDENTPVTVTATPVSGYQFDSWSGDIGDATPTDNPLGLTMDQHRSVTANFSRIPGVLSIADPSDDSPFSGEIITVDITADMTAISDLLGSFTGSLSWDPAVLSYQSDSDLQQGFSGSVDRSNSALGVISFDGSNGTGVGGTVSLLQLTFNVIGSATDVSGLDLAYTAMASSATVDLLPTAAVIDGNVIVDGYKLTLISDPPGGVGTVTISPDQEAYDNNTVVTLEATANEGFEFVDWSGDIGSALSTDNPITVTMVQDRTITVNYNGTQLGNFQPFGVVEVVPALDLLGQGNDVDTIEFWEAPDSSNTLMFVTSKGSQLVEVWKYPFVNNEQPSLVHPTFAASRVNGVAIDQETDLLYISISAPSNTISVFTLPDLEFVYNFNKENVDLKSEPNIGLFELLTGEKRLYVSADRIFYVHNAETGEYLFEFIPGTSVETVVGDNFYQRLYIPDESDRTGVYVFNPDGSANFDNGTNVFGGNNIFQSDAEGVIIYRCPHEGNFDNGCGLIIVSDQVGAQTEFEVFDRKSWGYLGTLKLTGVSNTDGIQSYQKPLPDYPMGIFAAINNDASTAIVGWDVIFAATGLVCPGTVSNPSAKVVFEDSLKFAPNTVTALHTGNIPEVLTMEWNYPNPFNLETTFLYGLPQDETVQVDVYNILGQRVRSLINRPQSAGYHRLVWDGQDEFGNVVGSGIYFVKLQVGSQKIFRKIILQK